MRNMNMRHDLVHDLVEVVDVPPAPSVAPAPAAPPARTGTAQNRWAALDVVSGSDDDVDD